MGNIHTKRRALLQHFVLWVNPNCSIFRPTNHRGLSEELYHGQMSAGGSFGGARGARPLPPEKGVFPLDHLHECDVEKKNYLSCLKSEGHKSEKCRHLSKKYLECRMEKNLMAKQDLSELGFAKEIDKEASDTLKADAGKEG